MKNRSKIMGYLFLFGAIGCFFFGGLLTFEEQKRMKETAVQEKIKEKNSQDAEAYCSNLYDGEKIKQDISVELLDLCMQKTEMITSEAKRKFYASKNKLAKQYLDLKEKINSYYNDNIIKEDILKEEIDNIAKENEQLAEHYKVLLQEKIKDMYTQEEKISILNKQINNMFMDEENKKVDKKVTRKKYKEALKNAKEMKQPVVKKESLEKLKIIDEYLTKKEEAEKKKKLEEEKRRKEEEKKQKERIKKAWVKIPVTYISQNQNKIYNGCEAASLLMALQYKGYLLNTTLKEYATNMPKSDDPNTGFYLDIFGKTPKDKAHWIAPAPLVQYGISSSGNFEIIDATGWSLEALEQEITKKNPVVIYATYAFLEPTKWYNGAPQNLHVQLLTGYNSITKKVIITDPWTASDGSYTWQLSHQELQNIYNKVGKRAIVVR